MFCRVEIVPYDEERELYEVKVYINERFFESKVLTKKELDEYDLSVQDAL